MIPAELRILREKLGMNQTEMAKRLRTPYRTYVDWERGARRIPGVCETAVELLLRHDAMVMRAITEQVSGGRNG